MRKMSACDPKRTQLGVRLPLPEHTRELLPSGRRSNAYLIEFRIDNEVMRGTGSRPSMPRDSKTSCIGCGPQGVSRRSAEVE
jgi:hypothetical protein